MGTMTQAEWIKQATTVLENSNISTARLDALVLLAFVTNQDKAKILAHPESVLPAPQYNTLNQLLDRRSKHEPIAYLTGKKEFYGREFIVTPKVLVPRPESEAFIDILAKFGPLSGKRLLDVGTGSGVLAITAKLENPRLYVAGSDISTDALSVAKHNAELLNADVNFFESSLLTDVHEDFDILIANLPYVPPDYTVPPDLHFEPALALYADNGGLLLIDKFLKQTPGKLLPGGVVLIECLQSQHADVKRLAKAVGLRFIQKNGLILAFHY